MNQFIKLDVVSEPGMIPATASARSYINLFNVQAIYPLRNRQSGKYVIGIKLIDGGLVTSLAGFTDIQDADACIRDLLEGSYKEAKVL